MLYFLLMGIRLGVLASGGGTSFEALTQRIKGGGLDEFEMGVVLSNASKDKAGVYKRADRLEVPCFNSIDPSEQLDILRENEVDMVLGLGYIKPVGDEILDHFGNRAWNIHPALLPKFGGRGMYGLEVHRRVILSGDREVGATVHIMTSEYDKGPILQQVRVPFINGESAEQLQQRVLPFEYALMATTLALYRDCLLPNCSRDI
jgi:phosphoribosylglycinamide formyltransferase 1